ncbi:leucine-rich repeat protein [Phosphitispora sp. TUW77]|uniref:leucine-rich repeat protein n=1 Tax=Phosphitispora sp. TUW77 TaxID=3152361 RepID=UPI003AB86AFD
MKKKLLSIIIVIAFMFSMIPITPITAYAAVEGDWLYTLYDGDTTAAITGYTGTDANITIPSTIAGKPVTRIGSNAFKDNTTVTSVIIPDTVLRIESSAFQNSAVTSVNLGDGVTYIGQFAFNGTNITSISIPSTVETIDISAFALCSQLSDVTINGNNLSSLGWGAFSDTAISDFRIPTSLSVIDDYTFQSCASLTSITIPSNITDLGLSAFNSCSNLVSATFAGNAPSMANFVFPNVHPNFTVYYYNGATGFTTPTWTPNFETYDTIMLEIPDTVAPDLYGYSVWRSDSSTAITRFMSNESGTYYYMVSDENTAPSTEDLSSWTLGTAISADTTITFSPLGLTTGEKYVHLTVKDASNNVSDVVTVSMPQDYCYFETFEAYPLNTNIASGELAPISQIHNGTGDANQKVVAAVDSTSSKMLSLSSTSGNASDQVVLLNEDLLAGLSSYTFEGDVYPLNTDGWQLRFSFTNGNYEGSNEAGVFFIDGTITTATRSGEIQLKDSYTANQWHHVKIVVSPLTNKYSVYVDDELLNDSLNLPSGIDRLAITAGHGKTAYYDNLEFYAVPAPSVCKILDTNYSSLNSALQSVTEGQTIVLLDDIEYNENIWAGSSYCPSFTLDLNGYELTVSNTEVPLAALEGYSLSVIDNSVDGEGILTLYAIGDSAPTGVTAVDYNSSVSIDSDVTTSITAVGNNSKGVSAYYRGAVEIGNCDILADTYGIFAQDGGDITVHGDVTVTSEDGYGAYAVSGIYGGLITVDGEINASNYIRINDAVFSGPAQSIQPTTKEGYLTYKDTGDSANPQGTVWVAEEEVPNWNQGIVSGDQYPFGGGDGSSAETAYEISTSEQLAQLAYNVNNGNDYSEKYFKLVNDLDLAGKEWTPIGYRFYPGFELGFNGSFDGNGNTINNMTIGSVFSPEAGGTQTQAGLFGAVKYQANIQNLNLNGEVYVNSVTSVGMLIGYCESDGTVSDCSASGSIVSIGSGDLRIGGLIGDTSGTSIINCTSDVDITASSGTAIGGLIGYHGAFSYDRIRPFNGGIYTGSLTAGNVPSYGGVGGIAGKSYGYTIIFNSVNKGIVSGTEGNIGGIVGILHNEGIINCYSSGAVSGSGNYPTNVGGINGLIDYGRVYNCYVSGGVSSTGTALVGALVGYGNSGTIVSNGYFDDTVNPDLAHVRSTSGSKYFLYEFTTEEMKGADPGVDVEYSAGIYASGEGAFESALNGWVELNQDNYPDTEFSPWDTLLPFNDGYPFLTEVQVPGPEHDASLESLSVSEVDLSPAFNSEITDYSANVINSIDTITVTAIPINSEAVVSINGTDTTSKDIDLNVGENIIAISVIAEDSMTTQAYTINIQRAASSGGGSSYTPPTIVINTEDNNSSTTNSTEISSATTSGNTSAAVSTSIVDALLDKISSVGGSDKNDLIELLIDTQEDTDELNVSILQKNLEEISDETDAGLSITSSFISILFDAKALETISAAESGGTIIISAGIIDNNSLSEEAKAKVQGRPVYDLTVMNGNTQVSDFNSGHATVTIPYTLQPGENPNTVVIYYLTDDRKLITVRGHYDSALKSVIFKTKHFSEFVIGYNPVGFADVGENAWYKTAVDFIAARGITSGTGDNNYSPEAKLTRAQFVVLLMKAYQINTQSQGTSNPIENFTDAGNTYYTDYLLAAKNLGIVNGVGNNMFAPEKEITRQEMFVMLYNALKVIDEVPNSVNDNQLSSFNDAADIAEWAEEATSTLIKAGVVSGNNNSLYPGTSTTRAEIAQLLYNLLS